MNARKRYSNQATSMRWRSVLATLALACLIGTQVVAEEREVVQLSTNGTTVLILRVDSPKLELPPQLSELKAQENLSGIVQLAAAKLQQVREGLQGETAYFAMDLPYAPRIHARMLVPENMSDQNATEFAKSMWPFAVGDVAEKGTWKRIALGSDVSATSPSPDAEPFASQTEDWLSALAVTQDYPVQCVVLAPTYLRETLAELNPELPPQLGGGPAHTLVAGARWLSLGIEPASGSARLVAQGESETAAQALKDHLPKLYQGVLRAVDFDQASTTMMMAVLGMLQPKVEGDRVILSIDNAEQSAAVIELVKAGLRSAGTSMAQAQTSNNLKQLGLAIHNYESAFGTLPTYNELKRNQVASGLSWRVHILPYIEEVELYQQFKMDEAWDSPHNIQLLDKMPEIFRPEIPLGDETVVPRTHTTYLVPVGERTIFGRDKPIGFGNISDGLSNTIAIVEVAPEHATAWTSPEEYRYDPANPAAKLRVINGRVAATLMDGSVQLLPVGAPWNALFTIDGGEAASW